MAQSIEWHSRERERERERERGISIKHRSERTYSDRLMENKCPEIKLLFRVFE